MHEAMKGSRLVTVPGRTHAVFPGYANTCANAAVNSYLLDALTAGRRRGVRVVTSARQLALDLVLRTLPTLERGRSSQTMTCFGVFTLPMRAFTKAITSAPSMSAPRCGCTTATTRSPHLSSGQPDHSAVLNPRIRHECLLHLDRIDVETAGDDHVLRTVDDEQEIVVVQVPRYRRCDASRGLTLPRLRRGSCNNPPSPTNCESPPHHARHVRAARLCRP